MLVILELINGAINIFLFLYFLHQCFHLKKPSRTTEIIVFIIVLLFSMVARGGQNNLVNLLVSFSITFLIALIYQESWVDRLMSVTFMFSAGGVCDFVTYVMTSLLFPKESNNLMQYMPAWLTAHILYLVLISLSLHLGVCIFKEHEEYSAYQPEYLRWIMLLVPFAYLIIGNAVFYSERPFHWNMAAASWPVILALLFLYFLIFFFYQTLLHYGKWKAEKMVFERMDEYYRKEISLIQQHQYKVRIMKHDMKNHLISLKSLLDQKKYGEAIIYIDEMIPDLGMAKTIHSGNVMIDGILNSKIYLATQSGIQVKTDINIPSDLKLNHTSITIILGNLLDNALEACGKLPSDRRSVDIKISWLHHVLTLEVVNTYEGERYKKGGRFLSDKLEDGHGMGLTSIIHTVNQNSGELEILHNETLPDGTKLFRVRILLYLEAK